MHIDKTFNPGPGLIPRRSLLRRTLGVTVLGTVFSLLSAY
jgi:hypothetical protein